MKKVLIIMLGLCMSAFLLTSCASGAESELAAKSLQKVQADEFDTIATAESSAEWPKSLSGIIPVYEGTVFDYTIDGGVICIDIGNVQESDVKEYIELLKQSGFTSDNDGLVDGKNFANFHNGQYELSLMHQEDTKHFLILVKPIG